jgi:hypothetical protein
MTGGELKDWFFWLGGINYILFGKKRGLFENLSTFTGTKVKFTTNTIFSNKY